MFTHASSAMQETPILDSGVLPVRVRKRNRPANIVGLIVGLFAGVLMIEVVGIQAGGNLDSGLGWVIFACALVSSISVHEFGHLLAGWLMRFRFSLISLGPLCLRLEHGTLKVSLLREMTALGYAGMHIDRIWRLRRRFMVYALAGPVAPLLLVPPAVLFVNHSVFARTHPTGVSFAAEFAMLSIIFSIISLVPMGRNSISDGSRIATLLSDKQGARRLLALSAIALQHDNGMRPRSWKQTWLSAGVSIPDESAEDFVGNWCAYVSCLDRKNENTASSYPEKCLNTSRLFGSTRDLVAQESAVFSAWSRRDALLADKWFAQVKRPKLIQPLQRIRTNVALCSGRGDFKAALNEWQRGVKYIEKLPTGLVRESRMSSWIEWRDEIEERQNALATA